MGITTFGSSMFDDATNNEIVSTLLYVDWDVSNNARISALRYSNNHSDIEKAKANLLAKLTKVDLETTSGYFVADIEETKVEIPVTLQYNTVCLNRKKFKELSIKRKSKQYPEGIRLSVELAESVIQPIKKQYQIDCNIEVNYRVALFDYVKENGKVSDSLLRNAIDYYRLTRIEDKHKFLENLGFSDLDLLKVSSYDSRTKTHTGNQVDWLNKKVKLIYGGDDD